MPIIKTKPIQITDYLQAHGTATIKELVDNLDISRQGLYPHLDALMDVGAIEKFGSPPKVFYQLATRKHQPDSHTSSNLPSTLLKTIQDNYFIIMPTGQLYEGIEGFEVWCRKQKLPLEKTAHEYVNTLKKYQKYKRKGLINGMHKLKTSLPTVYLNEVYYLDFYSIERFGKTKLGALMLYAKQSQSKELMQRVFAEIKDRIYKLIEDKHIDAVGFIPPTVIRTLQFQKEMERMLKLSLRTIPLTKVINMIPVPQKTLNKLPDRIENAASTIFVEQSAVFDNILLIDDAIGSGATLNETARKIKEKGIVKGKIIGLALTGSFSGFEVLQEV